MKKSKAHIFIFLIMCIFMVFFLIEWSPASSSSPPPHYGRFQLQSWAAPMNNGVLVGALVIDTATGETKTVYSRLVKSETESVVFINQLRKPFIQIR